MSNLSSYLPQTLKCYTSLKPITASSNGIPFNKPKSGGLAILELPLDKIRRPLMRTRANDPEKVKELMESISQIGLQEPSSLSGNDVVGVAVEVERVDRLDSLIGAKLLIALAGDGDLAKAAAGVADPDHPIKEFLGDNVLGMGSDGGDEGGRHAPEGGSGTGEEERSAQLLLSAKWISSPERRNNWQGRRSTPRKKTSQLTLMCWRLMEFITGSLDATAMRLTSAWVSQLFVVKSVAGQKKL